MQIEGGPNYGTAVLLMNAFACKPLPLPDVFQQGTVSPYEMAKDGRLLVQGINRLTITPNTLTYVPCDH